MQFEIPFPHRPPPKYEAGSRWQKLLRKKRFNNALVFGPLKLVLIGLVVFGALLVPNPEVDLNQRLQPMLLRTIAGVQQYRQARADLYNCYRSPRAGHECNRAAGRGGLNPAFFEFAPSGGTGMGAVAPYPNWLLQSEDFATTWAATNDATGTTAPTVTANFATDPLGGNTADRVQVASCLTAGWISKVQQAITTPVNGVGTFSVYVKGNGTSGTLSLCSYTTTGTCTSCAYTASAWARCTHSVAATSAVTTYVNAGCTNNVGYSGGVASAAQDVLLWGAQLDYGGGATYVATTTAAKGFTPTGAKNETLTFTRASTAMATATAGGGLATTGIQDGDLRLMPNNQPRVVYDANGVLGLLVESSRTNAALRSEEIDNAAWVNTGTAPTLNGANAAVAPDGTTTAEDYTFGATTAGQSTGRAQVALCNAAGSCSVTFYIKGQSGSGDLDVCAQTNETGPVLTCATCSYVSATWSRCSLVTTMTGAATGSLGTIYVGNMTLWNGGINRSSNRVFVWGAQAEKGAAYATSYIPTVAAGVTRSEEQPQFTITTWVDSTSWSMAASIASDPATAVRAVVGARPGTFPSAAVTALLYGTSGSDTRLYDGVADRVVLANTPAAARVSASCSGSASSARYNATSGAGAACSTSGVLSRLAVGFYTAGTQPNTVVSRVCLDPSPTRCQ